MRTFRGWSIGVMAIGAMCLGGESPASAAVPAATSENVHGNQCFAINGGQVAYSSFGVEASTNASALVMCPLPSSFTSITNAIGAGGASEASVSISIDGYERSSSSALVCSLVVTDSSGNAIATKTGSLSTEGPNIGTLSLISFTYANAAHGGPVPAFSPAYLYCNIPGITSNGGSYITNYVVAVQYQ